MPMLPTAFRCAPAPMETALLTLPVSVVDTSGIWIRPPVISLARSAIDRTVEALMSSGLPPSRTAPPKAHRSSPRPTSTRDVVFNVVRLTTAAPVTTPPAPPSALLVGVPSPSSGLFWITEARESSVIASRAAYSRTLSPMTTPTSADSVFSTSEPLMPAMAACTELACPQ